MSRPGEAPVPVGAPVPDLLWVGVDLGRQVKARGPIVHPTAARLLADLEAAIAARPPGWWRVMLPGAGGGRP